MENDEGFTKEELEWIKKQNTVTKLMEQYGRI